MDISLIDTIRTPTNCEFWIIEKTPDSHYIIKSDIFDKEKIKNITVKNIDPIKRGQKEFKKLQSLKKQVDDFKGKTEMPKERILDEESDDQEETIYENDPEED